MNKLGKRYFDKLKNKGLMIGKQIIDFGIVSWADSNL